MIPSIITFGEHTVFSPHKGTSLKFWNQIKGTPLLAVRFMSTFGDYLPDQLLAYTYNYIKSLAIDIESEEYTIRKHKGNANNQDNVIGLLEPLLDPKHGHFLSIFELLMFYIEQQPAKINVVTDMLKTALYPSEEYEVQAFNSIHSAYDLLESKSVTNYRNRYVFYYVMEHSLLSGSYLSSLYIFSDGEYHLTNSIYQLRMRFWDELLTNYHLALVLGYDLLMHYLDKKHHFEPLLLLSDKEAVIKLIKCHLSPENFADCYFVVKYLETLNEQRFDDDVTKQLEILYRTPVYVAYELLNTDRKKYRLLEKQGKSWEEINELNKADIASGPPVKNLEEFKKVYQVIDTIHSFEYAHLFDLSRGIYY